jgi:hypothetical protein
MRIIVEKDANIPDKPCKSAIIEQILKLTTIAFDSA